MDLLFIEKQLHSPTSVAAFYCLDCINITRSRVHSANNTRFKFLSHFWIIWCLYCCLFVFVCVFFWLVFLLSCYTSLWLLKLKHLSSESKLSIWVSWLWKLGLIVWEWELIRIRKYPTFSCCWTSTSGCNSWDSIFYTSTLAFDPQQESPPSQKGKNLQGFWLFIDCL